MLRFPYSPCLPIWINRRLRATNISGSRKPECWSHACVNGKKWNSSLPERQGLSAALNVTETEDSGSAMQQEDKKTRKTTVLQICRNRTPAPSLLAPIINYHDKLHKGRGEAAVSKGNSVSFSRQTSVQVSPLKRGVRRSTTPASPLRKENGPVSPAIYPERWAIQTLSALKFSIPRNSLFISSRSIAAPVKVIYHHWSTVTLDVGSACKTNILSSKRSSYGTLNQRIDCGLNTDTTDGRRATTAGKKT